MTSKAMHEAVHKGEVFLGHLVAAGLGFVLMVVGLGLGVTMIMLPVGLVLGLIGVLLFAWGVLGHLDKPAGSDALPRDR